MAGCCDKLRQPSRRRRRYDGRSRHHRRRLCMNAPFVQLVAAEIISSTLSLCLFLLASVGAAAATAGSHVIMPLSRYNVQRRTRRLISGDRQYFKEIVIWTRRTVRRHVWQPLLTACEEIIIVDLLRKLAYFLMTDRLR